MSKNSVNLQDNFLNQIRRDGRKIQMILTDGSKIEGLVRGFDNFTVIVHTDQQKHLVYKHAIAQLVAPRGPEDDRPSPDDGERRPRGRADNKSAPGDKPAKNDNREARAKGFNPLDLSSVSIDNAPQKNDEQGTD